MFLINLFRLGGRLQLRTQARLGRRQRTETPLAMVEVLENRVQLSAIVVTNLQDSGTGSLRAAVTEANSHPGADRIVFQQGLAGTVLLTSGQLEINDAVTIDGTGMSRLTISGNHASRVFQISSGVDVSIEDLTIADGRNSVQENIGILVTRGGAILNDGGQLSLTRVKMKNNLAIDPTGTSQVVGGGAVVNSGHAQLIAKDCYFVDNEASGGLNYAFGGAVANVTDSQADFQNCIFIGNSASEGGTSYGGAIGNFGSSLLNVTASTFTENVARGTASGESAFGGAIATRPGTVVDSGSTTNVMRSQFVRNRAIGGSGGDAGGGALYNIDSVLRVDQSCFLNNQAIGVESVAPGGDALGGAIAATASQSTVVPKTLISRSQFLGNQAVVKKSDGLAAGGALYNGAGQMELTQSRILGNAAFGGRNGQGIGGGIYNVGTVTVDYGTSHFGIHGNFASTSHPNVFGVSRRK